MDVSTGVYWHRDLLVKMAETKDYRCSVISHEVKEMLAEYLGFPHFYRHSYSFHLEWSELKPLVVPLRKRWYILKKEVLEFLTLIKD